MLRRFRDALAPGGRLLLDLDPLGCLAEPPSPPRFWESGDDLLVLHESRAQTDFVRQTSVSLLRYEQWRSGRLAASELELFALRFWGVLEFELALREAGFADILVCGDYRADTPPDGAATVVTFEARAA
ncbi:hypothetical protein N1F89_18385 [Aquibium sp. A9E412]|uniref:hypothetical protein n=1 Tax=Aquibium sp. A9E412 TaxID=2976767 RepID=UPI0025AF24BF|nr:hypothetical protein [Aquibium sp. A9E412]MDN2568197.1 hypothetical protein [Aquibium sp. A9E412]